MKPPLDSIVMLVEGCRRIVSEVGTSLTNHPEGLPANIQEATDALGKAHAALLKAVVLLNQEER